MALRTPGFVASVAELRALLEAGLRLDPPQSGLADETFALEAQRYLDDAAVDLADAHWDPASVGESPAPADLGRHAAYEVLAATAAHLPYDETGHVEVDLDTARQALSLVQEQIAAGGLGPLVRAFCTMATYENLQAVEFYQPMAEAIFVSGAWHRPWAAYPLQDDLLMAAASGVVRLRLADGDARQVVITPQGRALLGELRQRLGAAGVLAERRRLLALANGSAWWRAAGQTAADALHDTWEELLALAGIGAGSRVLVLGAAIGAEALVRQVAERVGSAGTVVVIDPALAMLRRFAGRAATSQLPNVRLVPGSLQALPLSDGAVDACLAPAFLHLTEHDQALAEVRRVVRPGGRVALAVPHAVDPAHGLLREWLQPLLELAVRLDLPDTERLHAAEHLLETMARHGFVGLETRQRTLPVSPGHFHASEVWRGVLERTPWRERQRVLGELGALWSAAAGVQAHGELLVAMVPLA